MSRYFKKTEGDYILAIGIGYGGEEITAEQYATINDSIKAKPVPADGYDYRLKTDLTWERYELPDIPEVDESQFISDSEALSIIVGGAEA